MGKAKLAILGASRGLGAALAEEAARMDFDLWLAARKIPSAAVEGFWHSFDFSQEQQWPLVVESLQQAQASHLIYCAAGGPYGLYGQKNWKDQEWALKVTFSFPAYLLWHYCQGQSFKNLTSLMVIGSAVAENKPDPKAAMYSAGKHALRGLVNTLQIEYPEKQISNYSAPYMDTDLLPKNAWPRQAAELVQDPKNVARDILSRIVKL